MRKTTIIMLIVAIVAVAGTQLGWWYAQSKKAAVRQPFLTQVRFSF
ncbi:TPA: protein YoaJ [Enterobacter hormaechei subsp. xiangfangensis]